MLFRSAEEMTAEMGANATMVTFTGAGHGQLLTSSCIDDIETALFNELRQPDDGISCDPNPPVDAPSWWSDLAAPSGNTATSLPAVLSSLGLSPTMGYGATWVTDADVQRAADDWATVFDGLGFRDLGEQDIGITGTVSHGFFDNDGVYVLVVALGPEAFVDESLAGAASSVPAGRTVVLVAYLP